MMTKNVLVTGGAGFIGSHLVDRLLKDGHKVTVLDNITTGRNYNPAAKFIVTGGGDCSDPDEVEEAFEYTDWVFHLAANPSVSLSVNNPRSSNINNLDTTLVLLETCRRHNVKRVVLSSTSAVYGSHEGFCSENQCPKPKTPYALQKYASEQYCQMYWWYHMIPTVSLRYFNVFGPRQSPSSPYSGVISKFCEAVIHNKPVTIHGDGGQCRDFTYVSDIVEANIHAATNSDVIGKSINIATGRSHTLNEVLSQLESICGTKIERHYDLPRNGDIYTSKASTELATSLDFKVSVPFETGLRSTLEWFRNR